MNPNLENLLGRLTKVKGRNGAWTACCPAHNDKGPSLAIKETPDGKILLHCFAGCGVLEIAGAVGMDLTDLFPPRGDDHSSKPIKPRFYATDLLRIIHFEALVVMASARKMANDKALTDEDRSRMALAYQRINSALENA